MRSISALIIFLFLGQKVIAQQTQTKEIDPKPTAAPTAKKPYVPLDSMSFAQIEAAVILSDSLVFDAYNNSKLQVYADYFSEDFEFYHDRGGLSTSKKETVDATEKNVFGKVKRELLPGSIEVSTIPRYGAVAIGSHRFYNRVENSRSAYSKFVTVWKYEEGQWRMTRVISLHK